MELVSWDYEIPKVLYGKKCSKPPASGSFHGSLILTMYEPSSFILKSFALLLVCHLPTKIANMFWVNPPKASRFLLWGSISPP